MQVRKLLELAAGYAPQYLLFVVGSRLSSQAMEEIRGFEKACDSHFQQFAPAALQFDVMANDLQPSVTLLREGTEAHAAVCEPGLMEILVGDPVAKHFAARVGDILACVYPSHLTVEVLVLRRVIKG